MEETNEFFVYNHDEREFNHVTADTKKKELAGIIQNNSVEDVENALMASTVDGILVLDANHSRWLLSFGAHVGIVAQRTARRQADSIARSGYQIPGKHRIKANYPLEELSETNIGDLWKTVQQKYVKSTLTGLELDETGIPSQIAERKSLLEATGYKDELTEAEQEKAEAEARKRAMSKSGEDVPSEKEEKSEPVKAKKKEDPEPEPKKVTKGKKKKTEEQPKEALFKIDVAEEEEEKVKKDMSPAPKTTKTDSKSKGPYFFEINSIRSYEEDQKTTFSMKGVLHIDDDEVPEAVAVFKIDNIPETQWDATVMFLEENDIVELYVKDVDGVYYVYSAKK